MKRFRNILFIVFLAMFFCVPFYTYAADTDYVFFTTTIKNWNHVDPIAYPCGSLNSTIELWNDLNHYSYGSCNNATVIVNNYSFTGNSDIVIQEKIRITSGMKKYGFYFLGLFGDSDEYSNTPFEAYLQRSYNNPGYFKVVDPVVIDPDSAISPDEETEEEVEEEEEIVEEVIEEEPILEEEDYEDLGIDGDGDPVFTDVEAGSTTNLGTVIYPNSYYLKYQFVVRGDLADPSGTFQYRFDEVESYRTAVHGDSIAFGSNMDPNSPFYKVLTLADLSTALEEKPEVLYTGVSNDSEYAVFLHTVGGDGYGAIVADPDDDDSYGLTLEIEARNDSDIANTGLLYDLGPFILLAIAIFALFFVFKKGKLKEESFDKIDDEIL